MSGHPDWLAVGCEVLTVRRSVGRSVVHSAVLTVTRQSATSIWATYPNGRSESRYVLKRGEYVATPRYLDYHETLEPVTPLDGAR